MIEEHMIESIRQLEVVARGLEPGPGERVELAAQVTAYVEQFLAGLPNAPAYVVTADNGRHLYNSPIGETGIDMAEALALLRTAVDTPGINPASGRHLGYIPGGGLFHAALGDYLAAVTNRYAGIFFASPGAVRLENMLLAWMADVVGYPANSGGTLTSGGSIANLVGIVTARDAHGLEAETIRQAVVYLTEHTHHSVDKALRIAGLRGCVQRLIPVDAHYRLDADALAAAISADRRAGLRPWLVVASAGATNTGAIDPLPAVAQITQANELWLHVDGAYGAFFALCELGRQRLAGMELSDSIVMDPHKTLFLPYGSGAVLVKERPKLHQAHYYEADYMQDTAEAVEEPSPADLSPELSKHFRGLRLWLPLQLLGVAPFRAALAEKMLLARYFHQQLQTMPGFEVGPPPDLSVVTYRYVPPRGDTNEFNRRLIQAVHEDGRVFLSSTLLNGRFVLRLAVGSFRTHFDDIALTLDILADKARHLSQNC